MARVMRGFSTPDVAACYDEPTLTGDPTDYNAARNGPAKTPHSYISSIYWHSDFVQHELAVPAQVISVTHTALNTQTLYYNVRTTGFATGLGSAPSQQLALTVTGAKRVSTLTLYTHNLGYKPHYMVVLGNGTIGNGTIIQRDGNGGQRTIVPYVTTTVIGLREIAFAGDVNLPATTLTYGLLLFREPSIDPLKPLFGKQGGSVVLGRGKIDSQYKYLRRVAGAESSVDLNLGPTVDFSNGGSKQVVGSTSQVAGKYQGDFSGSDYIPVDVSQ